MSRVSAAVRRRLGAGLIVAAGALALAGAAEAQPFGAWITFTGNPTHGFVRVPHNAALNPTGAFTFEAWVAVANSPAGEDCRSIAGKNWQEAWWIGQCTVDGQPTLRSYLKGSGSLKQGGIIPRNVWTHVAVTFDGATRRHYINGELAAQFPETGPLTTSASEMRIGSDAAWQFTPAGAIDEVRLWNVARTVGQIRANLNEAIATAQPGLVAVWALDGSAADVVGPRDGSVQGAGVGFLTFAVAFDCGASTATALCLQDRFLIRAFWRTNPTPGTPPDGQAQTVPVVNPGSGLFWFFSPDNWEIMVKAINACAAPFDRFWIFSASATNVFYRMEVTDVRGGAQKIYFNYPGPPAPALTDTDAFATCP